MNKLLKKKRIIVFIVGLIVIGLLPFTFRGLQFGMDFKGGSMINLELEEEATSSQMSAIVGVLTERVNAYGLKDTSIIPQESLFIRIEVAETDPKAVDSIKSIIGQQGSFETLYKGEVVLKGSDIEEVITNPQQGFGAKPSGSGYRWSIPFQITYSAAEEFSSAVEGECTPQIGSDSCKELLYMYIDRPENAVLIMNESMYQDEKSIDVSLTKETQSQMQSREVPIEEVVENSGAELVVTNEVTEEVLKKTENKTVVIPEETEQFQGINNAAKINKVRQSSDYWTVDALKLENIVHLTSSIASGEPVTQPSITGYSKTEAEAREEINRIQILLDSGKLPIGVQIESVDRVSAALGERFLKYSLLAGLMAIGAVVSIISLRYRRKKIILPLIITGLSEVIMILGAASWIGWQLDLPAVAGIIAVVGTGVDHLIIITDEAIGEKTKVRRKSVLRRIKRAFSIIMRAATTTIFAMFPLLFMGLGALQGFAITTIMGSLIGVLISRPAYGAIIRELL